MISLAGLALALAQAAALPSLDSVRAATARYGSVAVALADGYRPIGPDAPGMGRHYVNPLRVMAGQVTPDRPQGLSYARVGDTLELVAVAWILPVTPDRPLPAGAEGHWHLHSGSVVEEGNLFGHAMRPLDAHQHGSGVAMLHAWVGLDNPSGPLAADNWLLPFHRHGLVVSRPPTAEEAKALGLADDTEGFYEAQFAQRGVDLDRLRPLLTRTRARVLEWLSTRPRGTRIGEQDLAWLGARWRDLVGAGDP